MFWKDGLRELCYLFHLRPLDGDDSDTIGLHLKNIYQSGELKELATTEESSVVQKEGNRQVQRKIKIYNLDAIRRLGLNRGRSAIASKIVFCSEE